MNENLNYFRLAKLKDLDEINELVKKKPEMVFSLRKRSFYKEN